MANTYFSASNTLRCKKNLKDILVVMYLKTKPLLISWEVIKSFPFSVTCVPCACIPHSHRTKDQTLSNNTTDI